ncbi:MAG: GTPase Era [Sphaerochaeta sp.]|jgi:GTP-binding protein Era|nr:GTPase Era [Sphaerochaeta sp.]MCI2075817.1 GTPase Era [Sphaerochaeta sp.]MCI2096410.1 GTPase Era [Sphaerochaeta sp.]
MKCATVAVIGRPSSGKSTLVNTICEMKVSITAATPQTTRNAIRGIYTDQRGQLIFTDTPGYHLSEQKLNLKLQETAKASLEETDIVLYVIDPTRKGGEEELAIAHLLGAIKTPVVAVLNKSDIASGMEMLEAESFLTTNLPQAKRLHASAKEDNGVDEILIALFDLAKEGELLYPEDERTDQSLEFRITEIIREKAIATVTQEIPHAIYVELADLENQEETNTIWVRAFIVVETDSQKGIVIGAGGRNIRNIRVAAFKEIKGIFPGRKLQLDLRVKAQPKWRKNDQILSRIL